MVMYTKTRSASFVAGEASQEAQRPISSAMSKNFIEHLRVLPNDAAHQWRAASDRQMQTDAQSVRPLYVTGRTAGVECSAIRRCD